jgi:MgtE intracellular N domain
MSTIAPQTLDLTECLGNPVRAGESRLGTLSDLVVRLADAYPNVTRLKVKVARGRSLYLPWSAVATIDGGGVQLADGTPDAGREASPDFLDRDDLLLREHVLDTQILDLNGKRVVRVGDVVLTAEGDDLRLAAVEVGRASLLRRLGFRRLAARYEAELIAWPDVHLASGRGHSLQLRTTTAGIHRVDPEQLAAAVARLPIARGADVLGALEPRRVGAALVESHPDLSGRLVGELDRERAAIVLREMPVEAVADTLREMSPEQRAPILAAMPAQQAAQLERQLDQAPAPARKPSPVRRRFRDVLSARRNAPS